MLKKFLLNSLSAFVGFWIAMALFSLAMVLTCIAVIGSATSVESVQIKRHSILKLSLSGAIEEREKGAELDYVSLMAGKRERPQTLDVLVKALQEAKVNKNIDALYIECGGVSASPATLNALRSQIVDFKESGKRVYAYGDAMGMGDFFVASVADSLFINPDGDVALSGITGTSLYFKDLLDKVGIRMQVVKVGTFKSAVEPYISNEMSAPARAQLDTLYGVMWKYIVDDMAKSRKMKASDINALVDSFVMLRSGKELLATGLVDGCVYKRQVDAIMGRLVDRDPKKLNYVNPEDLVSQTSWGAAYGSKRQVAVLYATGDIAESPAAGIYCEKLVPIIVRLADDDNVKALVLRVNSPGGSVFGSEQIGEALDYFQSKGKKLAVSMGDYAASGGYWISACADRIFADPLTITGSIGIFGMIPDVEGLTEKIGVHPQRVSTNPDASFGTPFYPLTPRQHDAMQAYIEKGYDRFISRVAKGRHKSKDYIRTIAEGRVWNAMTAEKIGLVDQLGSLNDAIEWAAGEAGVADKYDVAVYPTLENSIWDYIPSSITMNAEFRNILARISRQTADETLVEWASVLLSQRPVQARAPYVKTQL